MNSFRNKPSLKYSPFCYGQVRIGEFRKRVKIQIQTCYYIFNRVCLFVIITCPKILLKIQEVDDTIASVPTYDYFMTYLIFIYYFL